MAKHLFILDHGRGWKDTGPVSDTILSLDDYDEGRIEILNAAVAERELGDVGTRFKICEVQETSGTADG